mgnify:CR=1 FL=1
MDLIRLFDHGAALDPERACFVEGERRTSYRETKALTERVARKLQSLGIARDRKVGVLSINSGDALSAAAAMSGVPAGQDGLPEGGKPFVDQADAALRQGLPVPRR